MPGYSPSSDHPLHADLKAEHYDSPTRTPDRNPLTEERRALHQKTRDGDSPRVLFRTLRRDGAYQPPPPPPPEPPPLEPPPLEPLGLDDIVLPALLLIELIDELKCVGLKPW